MQCAIIDLAADCVNQLFPLRKLPPLHLRSLHTDMFQFSFFVILHCDSHDSGLMTWNAFIQKSFGHHSKAVCLCLINCILQLRANSFVNWEDLKLKVCGHLEKEEDEEVLSKVRHSCSFACMKWMYMYMYVYTKSSHDAVMLTI